MSDQIHPIWAQLQAEFEALTSDSPPEQAAGVFARGGALMCMAALHVHPDAKNYITTRVVDEASGRHAVVSATWQDGVAPLAKLAIFEETLQALAAEGNEQALDAIHRARYQLGKSHASDVADLRAAAAGDPIAPAGGPTLDDRIATVIERLPSGGAIVDRLAREVARLTKGLVRMAAGEVDAKVLATLLVSGVEPDEAVRSACSLGGESQGARVLQVHEYPDGDFRERVRASALAAKVAIGGCVDAMTDEVLVRAAVALDMMLWHGPITRGISTRVAVAMIAENFAPRAERRHESLAQLLAEPLPPVWPAGGAS